MAAIPSVIDVVYDPHVNTCILVYNKEKKNKQIQKSRI